jgi:hypothetical protein
MNRLSSMGTRQPFVLEEELLAAPATKRYQQRPPRRFG